MAGYDSVGSMGTASNPFSVTSSGNGATADQVQGNKAVNTAPGTPVTVSGVANSGSPTPANNGTVQNFWLTSTGALEVAGVQSIPADGNADTPVGLVSNAGTLGPLRTLTENWSGTGYFRSRGDASGTYVVSVPSSSSPALLSHSRISTADINATVVKAAKAVLYAYQIFNATAAAKYLKLYNKATAPTGADTPVRRLIIPPNGLVAFHAEEGLGAFALGLAYTVTGALADADATAVAAGDVVINLDYV